MVKLLRIIIIFSLLWISTVWAGSMTFFPSTGNLGMYCVYSGEVRIDTSGALVSAIDSRIFSTNLLLSGFSPLLSLGAYERMGATGNSLVTVTYPWQTYLLNSPYRYVNRHADDLAYLLPPSQTGFFSFLFQSTGLNLNGYLDFYFVPGQNYDDSNIQSGTINAMQDIIDTIGSGDYAFSPVPCIVDQDPPLFTGYASGATYNLDIDTGFYFTIYDFTGNHVVNYNNTEHYRFSTLPADSWNLANYIPVAPGSGIDNQNGVSSGSISIVLSGIIALFSGNLLTPTLVVEIDCNLTYSGPGFPLTWNRNTRGYTCFVPFSGINFETSQTIAVIITGADIPNYLGETHTGSLLFSFDLLKSGKTFTVNVYPGSRPGGDFSNIGELRLYDTGNTLIASGSVTTYPSGTGSVFLQVPIGDYYAAYKGQSHLASYLSGVSVVTGNVMALDFTTGANLFNTQNKSISQNDGSQYQMAGDLKNIAGVYDFKVNGNDISILTMSGFIDAGIDVLDPKNLNGDTAINVSDISVIGVNVEKTDPFFGGGMFTW